MKRITTVVFVLLLCLSIKGSGQFVNTGNFKIHSGASVSFFSDINNNGTFLDSGLVVNMSGTAAQSISGSSDILFNNLVIRNSSSAGISLLRKVSVRGSMTFNTGVVNTTAATILELQNLSICTGASNSSFVSGPVSKIGKQAFVFPVGGNLVYAPISISAPALVSDQFTAEYFKTDPDPLYGVSNKDASIDHVSRCEFWSLERTAGSSDVNVSLTWDTRSCGVTSLADLRVASWNGTLWKDLGNGGTTGSTSAGSISGMSPVTSFGFFTLASISGASPLPIELVDFSGRCEGGDIVLEWSTASETNNDFFTVERSVDGYDWTIIQTIPGSGNSTAMLSYAYTDTDAEDLTSYYRLKQTDSDGAATYSEFISVAACSVNEDETLSLFPNPSSGTFSYAYSGDVSELKSIEVYNSIGEQIFIGKPDAFISLSNEQAGVYFFHLNLVSRTIVEKIVLLK